MEKERRNFISLIIGIVLILVGLSWTVIGLNNLNLIIIVPVLLLVVGSILAFLGGLRKW